MVVSNSEGGPESEILLVNFLDFLLYLGLTARTFLQLLHRAPEPEVLVTVLLLHVGQQLLYAEGVHDDVLQADGPLPDTLLGRKVGSEEGESV